MTSIHKVNTPLLVSRTSEETPSDVLGNKRTSDEDVKQSTVIIDLTKTCSNENATGELDKNEVKATKRQRDEPSECPVSPKKMMVEATPHIADKAAVVKSKSSSTTNKRRSATLHAARKLATNRDRRRDKGVEYLRRNYAIGKVLGQGGHGVVYSGIRKNDNLHVAVKCVQKDRIKGWGEIDGSTVPMEICLLQKLSKVDRVIQMVEWIETSKFYVIVMEKPEKVKDLFDYIGEAGRLDDSTAKKFFRQIVEAVRDVTKSGVVHRDLKSENVLVDLTTEQVKLIDFGSGTHFREKAYTYHGGTELYCPLEWFPRHTYQDKPAAVWSLGIILFHMACGGIPFANANQVLKADVDFQFKSFGHTVSNGLQDLVKQCLCKYPPSRPSLEDILEHPWLNEELT